MNDQPSRLENVWRGWALGMGLAWGMTCATCASQAEAAAVNLPGAVEPGHDRPTPQPEAKPNFDFSIEAPHRSPVPRAVDEIHFKLSDILVEGSTVFPEGHFAHLYSALRGHTVTLANIFEVADGIENEYRAAGYPLVRAYVPPQRVKDGVFTIRVVEGFVAGVSVEGGTPSAQQQVRSYLEPVLHERPLHFATIGRALLLSNAIPGVVAAGVLRPSPSVPAASDLVVTLSEPRVAANVSANNRGSHLTGVWTTTGGVAYRGLAGADELDATLTVSPGRLDRQSAGQVQYKDALGDSGLVGTIFGAVTYGAPGGSLGPAEIRSNSWAVGPRLTYPLLTDRANAVSLDAGFTAQDARVSILGVGISHDIWRVVDASVAYSSNEFLGGSFAYSADIAQGLPILGATPNGSSQASLDGHTTFTKITNLAHYTVNFDSPFSVYLSGAAQYAMEPLITGEQILFGGTQIGRGYDPGAITGDSGAGVSFEFRYDRRESDLGIQNLEPYAFFDTAHVWNRERPPTSGIPLGDFALASSGLGVRLWLPDNFYLDLEGARSLNAVPGSDGGKAATKFLTDLAVTF